MPLTHTPPQALRSPLPGRSLRTLLAGTALALLAAAASAQVVISQVYGGGGNTGATYTHDFIEIFNRGNSAVAVGGWSVQYASAGGSSWQVTAIPANTTLAAGQYYLIRQAQGSGGSVAVPADLIPGTPIAMSGTNGKVALSSSSAALSGTAPSGGAVQDVVSYGSTATPTEGSPTGTLSNTTAALRNGGGCTDTNNNSADFTVAEPSPRNLASALNPCGGGGGGGGGGSAVAIPAIQGSGATSPYAGQSVVTSGVVTRVNSNGFFIQDLNGDGNPATSDGIFVFTSSTPPASAAVGNLVQVAGTVTEFNVGSSANADTATKPLTQLTSPTVNLLGTGYTIAPTPLALPLGPGDSLERFEGMLVQITTPLTVQQNYFQARFGQLTLGVGRHETPTNRHRPNSTEALALADLQARSRLLLDDGSSAQNPNPTPYIGPNGAPRGGDTIATLTGVIDYGLATSSSAGAGLYRLHPTVSPTITISHPRPAAPAAVGGNVRVAAMNVLNYFTTFTDGSTASGQTGQGCRLGSGSSAGNCRGANNLDEFQRQRAKIVLALAGLDADVVGLMEIQNNGNTAAQNLVDALNAVVGAGTYAVVPDAPGVDSAGTDAIKVAMIYKPARVSRVGDSASDTHSVNNRPPLAQTFAMANGERFAVVVNHLKSKGSCPSGGGADADQGDGQGCWNATRLQQAQRLRTWVAQLQARTPAAGGTPDMLLVGDMNAYAKEDPIFDLTSNGFIDEVGRFHPVLGYSYVFDGTVGRLDHAISTASLSGRVMGVAKWHINADESLAQDYNREFKQPACATCAPDPYDGSVPARSSDHDPTLLGLSLFKLIQGTDGRDVLTGTPGDDILVGGGGADLMTGGGGINIFAYASVRDAGDTITDFVPGKDLLDLRTLLAGLGWSGSNPVAEGWIRFVSHPQGTSVQLDPDGPAGAAAFRALATLQGVSPASLSATRDLIAR